jgi:hypothetical protein
MSSTRAMAGWKFIPSTVVRQDSFAAKSRLEFPVKTEPPLFLSALDSNDFDRVYPNEFAPSSSCPGTRHNECEWCRFNEN